MSGSGCFVHRSVIGGLVPCLSKGFRGNCLRYSRHRLLSIVAHARLPVAMRSLASVTDLCMFLFLIQSIFRRRLTNVLSTFFACYRQTLRHGVICVLPVVVNYSSLDTISPHTCMVVGLFLSRVRQPGTACATNCENRC